MWECPCLQKNLPWCNKLRYFWWLYKNGGAERISFDELCLRATAAGLFHSWVTWQRIYYWINLLTQRKFGALCLLNPTSIKFTRNAPEIFSDINSSNHWTVNVMMLSSTSLLSEWIQKTIYLDARWGKKVEISIRGRPYIT